MDNIKIKEWMNIAKKYGAKFENIELVYKNGSFTIQSIDSNKEFHIEIPYPILLSEHDIEITDNTHRVRQNLDIAPDLRVLLDGYLDFILSDKRISDQKELMTGFAQMPVILKRELAAYGFNEMTASHTQRDLKVRLIKARVIGMNDSKRVLIPFIDFMNHNSDKGIGFEIGNNSVSVRGKVLEGSEIFAVYNRILDPFAYLYIYYFVPQAENALSMLITINVDEHTQLTVNRNINNINIIGDNIIQYEYCISKNMITIPFLWIGSHKLAKNPFLSFKKLWEEELHRTDTLRIYSILKSLNITKLVNIIRLCDSVEQSTAVKLIKECSLQQLTLIGESYEEII